MKKKVACHKSPTRSLYDNEKGVLGSSLKWQTPQQPYRRVIKVQKYSLWGVRADWARFDSFQLAAIPEHLAAQQEHDAERSSAAEASHEEEDDDEGSSR